MEISNSLMEELLDTECYVLKKKANYVEKIYCGLNPKDNVYKLYMFDDKTCRKGKRIARYQ